MTSSFGRRRATAAVVVPGLLLVLVGAARGSTPPPPDTGHASAAVQLPHLTITAPDGTARTVDLGAVTASALTDTGAVGALGLDGTSLLGTPVAGWQVDSSGGPQSSDYSVPLSATGVTGALDLAGYDVAGTGSAAHASLGALTGTVTTTPLDVHVGLGAHGLAAAVAPDTSTGTVDLTVGGLRLGFGDLLPGDVVAQLPLTGLVAIVSALGLPLPPGASDVATRLVGVADDVTNVDQATGQLAAAQGTLAGLLAALPSTAPAQQTLIAAQGQLATDSSALQAALEQLSDANAALANLLLTLFTPQQLLDAQAAVTAAQQQVTALQQTVVDDQAAVTAAQAALDALVASLSSDPAVIAAQDLVTQLSTTLTDLLATLTTDVTALPGLAALRASLLTTLTTAPLVEIASIGATVSTSASDDGASGTVTCAVSGVTVLGQPRPDGPCSDLVAAFASVRSAITDALDALPLAAAVVPTLDGLDVTTAGTTPAADDTSTAGSAGLTALHLALPSATLEALPDAAVTGLQQVVAPAIAALTDLGLPAITSTAGGALDALDAALGSLPGGGGLAGLRTVGVDVSLAGLMTGAVHYRSLASGSGSGGSAGSGGSGAAGGSGASGGSGNGGGGAAGPPGGTVHPARPPAGDTPSPGPGAGPRPRTGPPDIPVAEPAPVPRLPFTGSDAALDVAAALLLALAGAHLLAAARREAGSRGA